MGTHTIRCTKIIRNQRRKDLSEGDSYEESIRQPTVRFKDARTVPQRLREPYPWLVEKFHQEMRPQLTVSSLCVMNTQLPRLIIYTAHSNKQSLAWLHYRKEFQLIHVVLQSVPVEELIFPSVKNNHNKCITRHSTAWTIHENSDTLITNQRDCGYYSVTKLTSLRSIS